MNGTESVSEDDTANLDADQKSAEAAALPSSGPGDEAFADDENVAAAPVRGGKVVQHAGGLLLVALIGAVILARETES